MVFRYQGQKAKLSASELNRMNAAADRAAFNRDGLTELSLPDDQLSHWVWIRNDSGTDRARFECMSLGDPLFDLLADGTADLLFSADDAGADETPVILLEPIADGAFGKGVIHGLAIAKVNSGSTSATVAAPDSSGKLEPGSGSIKLLGSPSASTDTFLPVLLGASVGGMILIKTPSGGIPAATGSGPYTWGSATCTIVNDDGTVGTGTEVIKNIVNQAIAGSVSGKAAKVGSIYVVDVASCGA